MEKLILLVAFFLSLSAMGQSKKKKVNVFDFEADIIEGERKDPNIFSQVDLREKDDISAIYIRRDFNDFLRREIKYRPQFVSPKKKRK